MQNLYEFVFNYFYVYIFHSAKITNLSFVSLKMIIKNIILVFLLKFYLGFYKFVNTNLINSLKKFFFGKKNRDFTANKTYLSLTFKQRSAMQFTSASEFP